MIELKTTRRRGAAGGIQDSRMFVRSWLVVWMLFVMTAGIAALGGNAAQAGNEKIEVNFRNQGDDFGFYDKYGNMGKKRQNALKAAVAEWNRVLDIDYPVLIYAQYIPFGQVTWFERLRWGLNNSDIVAVGTPMYVKDKVKSYGSTYSVDMPAGLANQIHRKDLLPAQNLQINTSALSFSDGIKQAKNIGAEVVLTINSDWDTLGSGLNYELDTSSGLISAYTVFLHEITHGLGFSSFLDDSGMYSSPMNNPFVFRPTYFDSFLYDSGTSKRLLDITSIQRSVAATSNRLVFAGDNSHKSFYAKLYAPSPFRGGSSVMHLDTLYANTGTNDGMMIYTTGSTYIPHVGSTVIDIMEAMGWKIQGQAQVTYSNIPIIDESDLEVTFPLSIEETSNLNNAISFITDINIPDGSTLKPGQTFTKTWRVKNTGTSSWGTGSKWVFDSGNQMGGPSSVNVFASSGQTIDISVNLTAPTVPGGPYIGYWQMEDPNGNRFGPRCML